MYKIINVNKITEVVEKLKKSGKKIVLAGGCFDILHIGHILFLKAAKKEGDILFLLLESDENIKEKKGSERPINFQKNRVIVLSAIEYVDYIVLLNGVTKKEEYDRLIVKIKPDTIALTQGDPQIKIRALQCKMVGAKLKLVIKRVENKSTSALINGIKN